MLEYQEKFELLSGLLTAVSLEILKGSFLRGLKPKIHSVLRWLRPKGLGECLDFEQKMEEKKMQKK